MGAWFLKNELGWACLSKETLLLNSVYIGSNETFNNLNEKVDYLKMVSNFQNTQEKATHCLPVNSIPSSETTASFHCGSQVKWVCGDEALAYSASFVSDSHSKED